MWCTVRIIVLDLKAQQQPRSRPRRVHQRSSSKPGAAQRTTQCGFLGSVPLTQFQLYPVYSTASRPVNLSVNRLAITQRREQRSKAQLQYGWQKSTSEAKTRSTTQLAVQCSRKKVHQTASSIAHSKTKAIAQFTSKPTGQPTG